MLVSHSICMIWRFLTKLIASVLSSIETFFFVCSYSPMLITDLFGKSREDWCQGTITPCNKLSSELRMWVIFCRCLIVFAAQNQDHPLAPIVDQSVPVIHSPCPIAIITAIVFVEFRCVYSIPCGISLTQACSLSFVVYVIACVLFSPRLPR